MDIDGNLKKMNRVQVFGMQRSGTNFIEWTLRNNFVGLEYDGSVSNIGNVKGDMRFGMQQSLKHCLPDCTTSELSILIQRDYEEWDKSVKNKFKSCQYTKETYDYYYDTPYREKWDENTYLHINHRWAVLNYYELLEQIANRLNLTIKENWKQPTKRLHYDSGRTLLDIDYNINVK